MMNCQASTETTPTTSEENLIDALANARLVTDPIPIVYEHPDSPINIDYDIVDHLELNRRLNCNTPTPYTVHFPEDYNYKLSSDVENYNSTINELQFSIDTYPEAAEFMSRTYTQYYIFSIFPSATMAKTILPREFSFYDSDRYNRVLDGTHDTTKHTMRKHPRNSVPTREFINNERNFEHQFRSEPVIPEHKLGPHLVASTTISNEICVENHCAWQNPVSYFRRLKSFVTTPIDTSETIKHFLSTQLRDIRHGHKFMTQGRTDIKIPTDNFNFGLDVNTNDNRGTLIVNIYLHGNEDNFLLQDGALGSKYVSKKSVYHAIIDVCADYLISPFIIDNSCSSEDFASATPSDVDLDPYVMHERVLQTILENAVSTTKQEINEPIEILDAPMFREFLHMPEQLIYQPNCECCCDNNYGSAYSRVIAGQTSMFKPDQDSPLISTWLNSQFPIKLDYLTHNYVSSVTPIIDRPIVNFTDSMAYLYKDVDPQFSDNLKASPCALNLFQHLIHKETQHNLDKLSVTNVLDVLAYPPKGTPENIMSYLPYNPNYSSFEQLYSHRCVQENYPIPKHRDAPYGFQDVDYLFGQGTSRCFIIKPKTNSITKFLVLPTTTALSNKTYETGNVRDKFLLTPSYVALSTLMEYLRSKDVCDSTCHRCISTIMCRAINAVSFTFNFGSFTHSYSQCFTMNHHSVVNSRLFDPTRTIPSYHTDSIDYSCRPVIKANPFDHVVNFGDFLQRVYYDLAYGKYMRNRQESYAMYGDDFMIYNMDDLVLLTLFSILCGDPSINLISVKPLFFPRVTLNTMSFYKRLKYILTIDTENHITSFNPSPLSRMANKIRHNLTLLRSGDSFNVFPSNSSLFSQVA